MQMIKGFAIPDEEVALVEYIKTMTDPSYQSWKIDQATRYARNKRVSIDIGAHIGLVSAQLAEKFEKVFAFEPNASLDVAWQYNTRLHENIHLYNTALGNFVGRASLDGRTDRTMESFITDGDDFPMDRLDSYQFREVDFIKLDVEGYEQNVLYGAEETIFTRNNPVLLVEHRGHEERFGEGSDELFEYLSDLGFEMRRELNHDFVFTKDTFCTRPPEYDPNKPIVILGSGPSAEGINFTWLQDEANVIAINDSIRDVPRALSFFSIDGTFFGKRKLLDYEGQILIGIHRERFEELEIIGRFPKAIRMDRNYLDGLSTDPMTVRCGASRDAATSGRAALNLAMHWVDPFVSDRRVILVGFDNGIPPGDKRTHRNRSSNFGKWTVERTVNIAQSYESTVRELAAAGIDVLNASQVSTIECFPKVDIYEVL